MNKQKKSGITLKEIAEMARTSATAVSRALNMRDGVSEETRARIMQIATENGYRPNLLARSMRSQSTNLLGIIVGDIERHYFIEFLHGAEEEARRRSYTIIIGNANEDWSVEKETIETFRSYNCSGIAICPVSNSLDALKLLRDEDLNFVVFDRAFDEEHEFNQVVIDNKQAAFIAVEHLVKAGHERVAMIASEAFTEPVTDRRRGYEMALRSFGISPEPRFELTCLDPEDAQRQTQELLNGPDRPTALFIADEAMALKVVSAVTGQGLSIPDDVSVLVFGNPDWAPVFSPGYTCVERPTREMGRATVRMLAERAQDPSIPPQTVELTSQLILRGSVTPPRAGA